MKKFHFIFVLYKTPVKEVARLKKEVKDLGLKNYSFSFIDNTNNNQGFAAGINQGIKQGLTKKAEIFVIANPDISFLNLKANDFIEVLKKFDIAGFAFCQDNKTYYGGELDKWRLSGHLIKEKPKTRFVLTDFISGSLMIIKKSVIDKIGLFDESYFLYYEEVDYCWRAKKAGFKIGIDSSNQYLHFEDSKKNQQKEYFLVKNRWRFFWRYANLKQKLREIIRLPKTMVELLPFFKNTVIRSSFLKDFFSLNLSNFLNKVFHFFLFLFLIRALEPADYGQYNLVWAFIGFFNPFLDLGTTNYGLIYSAQEDKKKFEKFISLRFFISLVIFLLINLVGFFSFKSKLLFLYIFFCSIMVLANAWSGSYLILNSIKQKVINSSLASLLFNLFFVLSIIGFYLVFRNLLAIFLAVFISFFIYFIVNYYLVLKEIKKYCFKIDIIFWKKIIRSSLIFVLISFFAGLRFKLDVFLLNFYKNSAAVGLFSSGYKFFEAAIMIAGSYNIVALPIYSQLTKDWNRLKIKLKKDLILLLTIGLAIALGFYFFGPIILPILFKKNYLPAIDLARYLMLDLPLIFFLSVVFNLFYILKKANYVLYALIFRSILAFILNLILIPVYSYWSIVLTIILGDAIVLLTLTYLLLKNKKDED